MTKQVKDSRVATFKTMKLLLFVITIQFCGLFLYLYSCIPGLVRWHASFLFTLSNIIVSITHKLIEIMLLNLS